MVYSNNATNLIKLDEQLSLTAYNTDGAGVWTIGWGHTRNVKKGDTIDLQTAEKLLEEDLQVVVDCLRIYIHVELNQNQYDALTSFIFNIGGPAFSKSTILTMINEKKFSEAAQQFDRWIYAGSKVLRGLVVRRAREKELFLRSCKS